MELIQLSNRSLFKKKSNIKLAKAGNQDAFEGLINEQLTALYRVAKGILNTEHDVEDAIQNTIVKAFDKIKYLREDKYFKTWLIRILINECNKIYNYNKREVVEVAEETYTVDKAENMDLYDAISKLTEDLRVTTILYYFDDMSYSEISKALDVAEGTVKSRLFRSREKLHEILKGNN
ncbi:MAG: RNA polymerase sigma factor [Clostridium sp.]